MTFSETRYIRGHARYLFRNPSNDLFVRAITSVVLCLYFSRDQTRSDSIFGSLGKPLNENGEE